MNKKKIIISASILTTAIVALSVSLTLAWYGASDRLNVENLELTMSTKANLKISTSDDLDTFVTDLSEEQLHTLPDDFLFAPVSSMNQKLWMDQQPDKPSFYDCSFKQIKSNGEPYAEVAEYGYFQKDIYLLTSMRNQFATLDFDSTDNDGNYTGSIFESGDNSERAAKLYKQNPEWNLSKEEIETSLDNLINCVRISLLVKQENFYRYYVVDPMKKQSEVVYLGGRLDNDGNGYYDTYKDAKTGETKEVIYGEVNNRDLLVYNDPIDTPSGEVDNANTQYFNNSFKGVSRANVYTYNQEASLANDAIMKENSYSPDDINDVNSDLLIPLEANVPTKIVLSFYLEGWDFDCINATMGANFKSKISFKLKGGNI